MFNIGESLMAEIVHTQIHRPDQLIQPASLGEEVWMNWPEMREKDIKIKI